MWLTYVTANYDYNVNMDHVLSFGESYKLDSSYRYLIEFMTSAEDMYWYFEARRERDLVLAEIKKAMVIKSANLATPEIAVKLLSTEENV